MSLLACRFSAISRLARPACQAASSFSRCSVQLKSRIHSQQSRAFRGNGGDRGDFRRAFDDRRDNRNDSPWWRRLADWADNFFENRVPSFLQAPAAVHLLMWPNFFVFGAWSWFRAGNDNASLRWMQRNFMLSAYSGPHTLLTHAFSHNNFFHLLFNMFALFNFGPSVCALVGAREFLAIYLASAVAAGAAQREASPYGLSLGASGAVYAVMSSYALTYPKERILLYGIIPMPALVFVGGLCALDYYKFGSGTNTGHAAHLVGALSGAAFWALRIRGRFYA